jgi:hypothetical protein
MNIEVRIVSSGGMRATPGGRLSLPNSTVGTTP